MGVNIMAIPAGAKHKDEAAALMRFLLEPKQQEALSEGSGQLPFNPQAVSWDYWTERPAVIDHFIKALAYGFGNPANEHWFDIRGAIRNAVTQAFDGKQSPANALSDADRQTNAFLSE